MTLPDSGRCYYITELLSVNRPVWRGLHTCIPGDAYTYNINIFPGAAYTNNINIFRAMPVSTI